MGCLTAELGLLGAWLAKLPPHLREGFCTSVSSQPGLGTGSGCFTAAGSTGGPHRLPKACFHIYNSQKPVPFPQSLTGASSLLLHSLSL